VVIVAVTTVFVEEAFTEALALIKFTAGRVTNQDISLLRAETKEEMKNKDLQGRTNSITTAT
jgi:energy-converting hydrogenase Eha subunit E